MMQFVWSVCPKIGGLTLQRAVLSQDLLFYVTPAHCALVVVCNARSPVLLPNCNCYHQVAGMFSFSKYPRTSQSRHVTSIFLLELVIRKVKNDGGGSGFCARRLLARLLRDRPLMTPPAKIDRVTAFFNRFNKVKVDCFVPEIFQTHPNKDDTVHHVMALTTLAFGNLPNINICCS